jgi:hypothetical protein
MPGDSKLLESDVMSSGKYLLTFQRTLFPQSSGSDLLTLEDETLRSFEMMGYVTLSPTEHNNSEDQHPQHQYCNKPQTSHK